ncbi:MAG: T9SS type B sorting domain-containing protein [Bacteroidia bacterium]
MFCFAQATFAQKEANIWYFGEKAGLDFNSGSPVALTDGELITREGCATISDKNGKLLFYTDGVYVWNKMHKVMPNGSDLKGDPSSTQSGIIVPYPSDTTKFYIFTVDDLAGPDGFQYSVVDLTKDNGNGDLNKKNIILEGQICEKLTSVQHNNKKDIWVIVHLWESRKFAAYLVTDKGISKPVYSEAGIYYGGSKGNSAGALKVSPNGKRLAATQYSSSGNGCQILDFDNNSGKISNSILIDNINWCYGLEFSPNSKLLYVGLFKDGEIYQYNIDATDTANIKNERILIANQLNGSASFQLGPDKVIYIAQLDKNYLHVIGKPDEHGSKCNFIQNSISLNGRISKLGLPAFIQSYFESSTYFNHQSLCAGSISKFEGFSNLNADKWEWDFGDSITGSYNFANDQSPQHVFSAPGKYIVKLKVTAQNFIETVEKEITVLAFPVANLGPDKTICDTTSTTLFGGEAKSYYWSTGDTTKQISVNKTGTYWVMLKNASCTATDTINIAYLDEKDFWLGNDIAICEGQEITLRNNIKAAKYLWNSGSTEQEIKVNKSGKYWLATLVANCVKTDTINISVLPFPEIDLGENVALCEGDETELDAGNPGAKYLWNTGETSQIIKAKNAGKYWVNVSAGTCLSTDTILLNFCPPILHVPNVFSPNNDGLNDTFRVYCTDVASAELQIYNRWGECVYESADLNKGWNGKFKGTLCPEERYVWLLRYTGKEAPSADYTELSGIVQLIR